MSWTEMAAICQQNFNGTWEGQDVLGQPKHCVVFLVPPRVKVRNVLGTIESRFFPDRVSKNLTKKGFFKVNKRLKEKDFLKTFVDTSVGT